MVDSPQFRNMQEAIENAPLMVLGADGMPSPAPTKEGVLTTTARTNVTFIGPLVIPGVGTGAAYASGDVMGTILQVTLPSSAMVLHSAIWHDLDNEKIQKDITIYRRKPADTTADNSAFDPPDADALYVCAAFSIGAGDYIAYSNSAVGVVRGLNMPIVADADNTVWVRVVTRGADNIAAGSLPSISFGVI